MDERKSVYVVVDDEQMTRVRSAMEDVTSLVDSLRLGCEIAYRREPTQAEGDAHELPRGEGVIRECHVPMGNHHGHRCTCGRWVWGGPTVCQRCVDAEAVKIALEWKAEADRLRLRVAHLEQQVLRGHAQRLSRRGAAVTPDLEALARRAVACPRWRWMPGMACQWDHPRRGAGGQQVLPTWARVVDLPAGPLPLYHCLVDVGSVYRGALPDLSDPATVGCLLALVRETHNAPHAWVEVRHGQRARVLSPDNFSEGARMLCEWQIGTEAAALVAALEAAP